MSARLFWNVTRWARAARFWLLLLAGLLVYLGAAEARAACVHTSNYNYTCDTRQEAYAKASEVTPAAGEMWGCTSFRGGVGPPPHKIDLYGSNAYSVTAVCNAEGYMGLHFSTITWTSECPAGLSWDEATKKCACPAGSVAQPDGSCKSCEDLNGEPGSPSRSGVVVRPFAERCVSGCQLKMTEGWCVTLGGVGGGEMMCTGQYLYTGQSCSADPAPPEGPEDPDAPEPEEEPDKLCKPLGAGQTVCVKPNGDQCYTATRTGRQICWKPGETGEKGDGPTLQTRGPGTSPTPPSSPTTSAGDPYVEAGDPMTTTASGRGGANGGLTIVTTAQNHETENGTNAKPEDSGEPEDGAPDGGNVPGEDDGTSATGGGDCSTPPIVSGDAALNMVANQAWATRCAVEAGNAANVTGDVGDCSSPFSVEGTNANAEQLRALRASICGEQAQRESDAEVLGNAADALEPGEGDSVFADGPDEGGPGISLSRFGGGGGCPTLPFEIPGVGSIDTTQFCNYVAMLRLLILAIATIWALRIVGSE